MAVATKMPLISIALFFTSINSLTAFASFSELEVEHSIAGEGKVGEVELEQAYIEWDLRAITAQKPVFSCCPSESSTKHMSLIHFTALSEIL